MIFRASRANIPAVRIVGFGDSADAVPTIFMELGSSYHRSIAHPGTQEFDSRGQPSILGPFLVGFIRSFQQAEFCNFS